MKLTLHITLIILLSACSDRARHAAYDMLHEKQRQDCLQQGRTDCPSDESYDKYKQKRDEVMSK